MVQKRENKGSTTAVAQKPRRWRHPGKLKRVAVAAIVAIMIFGLGVEVGNGHISFGVGSNPNNLPLQLNYSTVNQVYQSLKANYDGTLTQTQLIDGLKHGLAEATNDPYTEYFTPSEAKAFNSELNNSFSGIGAELGQDSSKNLQIIAPIDGSPAAKAGLKPQDLITTINGQSTSGMSVDAAVNKIRGPSGSKVILGILRGSQTLNITITRANIQVPSVTTKILNGTVGYIAISTFSDDTGKLAVQAADKFKQQGVKSIILDLRGNPGGLLSAAVDVSSLWLPEGTTIVTEKGTIGTDTSTSTGDDTLHGIPTVVLIDGGSASASEITAGALHDNHAAYLIGEKSYGKGVVQQLINFNDGSQLKVTVAQWYRPDGQNIQHKGITPDKTVAEPDNATATNDPQLSAAENYLAGK